MEEIMMSRYAMSIVVLLICSAQVRAGEGGDMLFVCKDHVPLPKNEILSDRYFANAGINLSWVCKYLQQKQIKALAAQSAEGTRIAGIYAFFSKKQMREQYVRDDVDYQQASQNLYQHQERKPSAEVSASQKVGSYVIGALHAGLAGRTWVLHQRFCNILDYPSTSAFTASSPWVVGGVALLSFLIVQQCVFRKFQHDVSVEYETWKKTECLLNARCADRAASAKNVFGELIKKHTVAVADLKEAQALGGAVQGGKWWLLNMREKELAELHAKFCGGDSSSYIPCTLTDLSEVELKNTGAHLTIQIPPSDTCNIIRIEPGTPIEQGSPKGSDFIRFPDNVGSASSSNSSSSAASSNGGSSASSGAPLNVEKSVQGINDTEALYARMWDVHCRDIQAFYQTAISSNFAYENLGNVDFPHRLAYENLVNGVYKNLRNILPIPLASVQAGVVVRVQEYERNLVWALVKNKNVALDVRNALQQLYSEILK